MLRAAPRKLRVVGRQGHDRAEVFGQHDNCLNREGALAPHSQKHFAQCRGVIDKRRCVPIGERYREEKGAALAKLRR